MAGGEVARQGHRLAAVAWAMVLGMARVQVPASALVSASVDSLAENVSVW